MTEPPVVRPRKLTWMAWAMAALVIGVFAFVGWGLRVGPPGDMRFGPIDQALMTGLGVCLGGAALVFTRARVVAGVDGIRVRNAFRELALPWEVVAAVRFDDGASWASLDLQDDENVALMAVQANDGQRAVEAVQALRRLLAQSREQA